jgi:hypothetical protein
MSRRRNFSTRLLLAVTLNSLPQKVKSRRQRTRARKIQTLNKKRREQISQFDIPPRIQDANLASSKRRAALRIMDCLIFLREYRLDAGRFKNFPSVTLRPDFDNRGTHIK